MDLSSLYVREGRAISKAKGSLLVAESIPGTKFNEIVDVELSNGEIKPGQAIDISEEATIVQVFGGVSEVDLKGSKIRCKGETLKLPVSVDILGRIFNGMGKPIDGGPPLIPEEYLGHRWPERSGQRTEATHLQRVRAAAQPHCRPDSQTGCRQRKRGEIRHSVSCHWHQL